MKSGWWWTNQERKGIFERKASYARREQSYAVTVLEILFPLLSVLLPDNIHGLSLELGLSQRGLGWSYQSAQERASKWDTPFSQDSPGIDGPYRQSQLYFLGCGSLCHYPDTLHGQHREIGVTIVSATHSGRKVKAAFDHS